MLDMPARGDTHEPVDEEAEVTPERISELVSLPFVEKHEEAQDNEVTLVAESTSQSIASVTDAIPLTTEIQPVSAMSESKSSQPVSSHKRNLTRPVVPIIPIRPVVSNTFVTSLQPGASDDHIQQELALPISQAIISNNATTDSLDSQATTEKPLEPVIPAEKAAPKSWAELLRSKAAASSADAAASVTGAAITNGIIAPKVNSLADAVRMYDVNNESKISFLKPRGLVNTGNMCYMNAVSSEGRFFSNRTHGY